MGSLESLSGHPDLPRACYLDLQLTDFHGQTLSVTASTSRGELRCWLLHWPPRVDPDEWVTDLQWVLPVEPIPPYQTITKPALNCLSVLEPVGMADTSRHLIVGVDDGSVRVASVGALCCQNSSSVPHEPRWVASAVHHFATVLRLCTLPTRGDQSERMFVTLSADQRLILWSFNRSTGALTPSHRVMLSGLGDPHGMHIVTVPCVSDQVIKSPEHFRTYILTTGVGSALLELSSM
ncbi:unnamed protein product [Echinostoma caproni]|uniref:WD_REPEATS_REGION domain-containing protein n=1 Tax=Echinostoma caproni TaxID=27848 RepID=A0A183AES3_9TREM|nr:unnamed protein product [Echinostoma caproni]